MAAPSAVYRPRNPQSSDYYRCVEDYFETFVRIYDEDFSRQCGVFLATSMFTNMTRALVYIIGILIILQSLGISITPILTALGVGGLAVALALQDTLSNLFAGIHVIASGQIKPGHYLKLSSSKRAMLLILHGDILLFARCKITQ